MTKFALLTTLGFSVRLLLIAPIVALLVYTGEHLGMIDNISTFILILLAAFSVVYLAVMTLIPAEYAIRTDIKIIEYNMWLPQIISVYATATIALGLAVVTAAFGLYPTAMILFLYAASTYMWPRYIKRIDIASKDHMIKKLQGEAA